MTEFDRAARDLRAGWGDELSSLDAWTFAAERARQLLFGVDGAVVALLTWQHDAGAEPDTHARALGVETVQRLARHPRWQQPALEGGGDVGQPGASLLAAWGCPVHGGQPISDAIAYIAHAREA